MQGFGYKVVAVFVFWPEQVAILAQVLGLKR